MKCFIADNIQLHTDGKITNKASYKTQRHFFLMWDRYCVALYLMFEDNDWWNYFIIWVIQPTDQLLPTVSSNGFSQRSLFPNNFMSSLQVTLFAPGYFDSDLTTGALVWEKVQSALNKGSLSSFEHAFKLCSHTELPINVFVISHLVQGTEIFQWYKVQEMWIEEPCLFIVIAIAIKCI